VRPARRAHWTGPGLDRVTWPGRIRRNRIPVKRSTIRNNLKTVDKTFAVVDLLQAHGAMRLTAVAEALGLKKATAHRLLSTLDAAGYALRDDETGKYGLSLKFFEIGAAVLRGMELRKMAAPFVEELSRSTAEVVNLAVLSHGTGLIIEKSGRPEPLRLGVQIGEPVPLHSTGLGKVLLADLSPEARRPLLGRELRGYTDRTLTDPRALERELERVRARGYATDMQETNSEVRCVAAPVRSFAGRTIAAISVSGYASRLSQRRIRELAAAVSGTAFRMSEKLGLRRSAEVR
jgi:DNA-binding IclR family transcriptional regulator